MFSNYFQGNKLNNIGIKRNRHIIFLKTFLIFVSVNVFWGRIYAQTLHLYGGKEHDEYLGCINCDKYNTNSIWNAYGKYGSKYNSNSIWNAYGKYGSKYSATSPWNQYASNPPVIVDKNGGFYGYFTVNKYNNKRADFGLVEILYEYHEVISDDVSKYYDNIFK